MTPGREQPGREEPAQQGPPGHLTAFPAHRLSPTSPLYRAHQRDRGPWWFASGGGRFDLVEPRGTCYLATTASAALRERLGPVLARRATVPASTLDGVVVSTLRPGAASSSELLRLANLRSSRAAEFGVTRELESMTPYDVPRRWASAFDAAGWGGIRYGPRFSPGGASAIALFGPAGEDANRPVDPEPVAADGLTRAPATVSLPQRAELTVIAPPRRGGRTR
ncbi:RES family NAD+ phosphorylase [Angustibacter luteus]|uniref:RES family NAD+ phosphorylase n=1 Tax=Angustibacter luteus TaxID=658456 RepID=A0ABW1J9K5_9ACTN